MTEACTNALIHGRADAAEARVSWEIERCTVRFLVQDYSGQRWSRAAHPSRGGGDGRVGGFGLELMRGLMDEVEIRAEPHGTTVELVKRFC